ncbi:MAG: MFS transporter [Phycisphaerales bacterium]|nr:MFS transporter [Phycisphaerales bacterium]
MNNPSHHHHHHSLPNPVTGELQRGGWYSWVFWGIVAVFYLYEFFVRVTPNVILPQISTELSLDPGIVGSAMSTYLWVYAPTQLVVGWLFDRFGTKFLVSTAAVICGIGCILFAGAHSLGMASAARGFIGFGSAFAFVGAVYVATVWFPPARLALIAGMTTSVGMIGEVVGQYPMARLAATFDWRTVVFWSGIIGGGLGVLMFLVIPRRPSWFSKTVARHETDEIGLWHGIAKVLGNPQMWMIGFVSAVIYLPLSVLAALWGTSSLETLNNLDANKASLAISMLPIGWLIGCPIIGILSDRFKKRRPFLLLGCVGGGITMLILLIPNLSYGTLIVLLLVSGLATSSQAITFALAMEVNARRFRATSVAICNFLVMLMAAFLQVGIGWILNWRANEQLPASIPAVKAPSAQPMSSHVAHGIHDADSFASLTATDWQWALAMIPILFAVATVLCFFVRETHAVNTVDPAPAEPRSN